MQSSVNREFEIPPGFERVKGNSSMTQESILSKDKELWFFKLPKNVSLAWLGFMQVVETVMMLIVVLYLLVQMDASVLSSLTFKVGKSATPGEVVATVQHEGNKTFVLQNEDPVLTMQLTNAFPVATDRTKFALGKPFTRCFSLLEDRSAASTTTKKTSKRKSLEPVAVTTKTTKVKKSKVKK